MNLDVQTFEIEYYNEVTKRMELTTQCTEKRDTLRKLVYFLPGYFNRSPRHQLPSLPPQAPEQDCETKTAVVVKKTRQKSVFSLKQKVKVDHMGVALKQF